MISCLFLEDIQLSHDNINFNCAPILFITITYKLQDLDKVGVYGYVNDATTSESVLANNPDSGTDAGQFAIIPKITTTDKNVEFEFIAAVPKEKVKKHFL